MSTFDQGLIAEIKSRLRIEDVVGRFVELRSVGNRLVAPCPFHQETKPSFSVNPEGGFYYCFGCQASGDLIDFYRAINGMEFGEAVEALAREAGVQLRSRSVHQHPGEVSRTQCLNQHAVAVRFYQRVLASPAGEEARAYLERRGITSATTEYFALGWAPTGWNDLRDHLRTHGHGYETAEQCGLLSKSAKGSFYDRFRERLIFPIFNLSGQVIAFGGRCLKDEHGPKYLNSAETPIYTKGEHLYGLYQARRAMAHHKHVLLTEGYVDVLSLHQFGFTQSCGVLGTALTREQVHRLSGLVGRVDLLFDGDAAGHKAALRSAEMILTQGLRCRVVCLPDGHDVDSVLHSSGSAQLNALLDQAVDGLDYCLRQVAQTKAPKDVLAWAIGFVNQLHKLDWRSFYIPKIAAGLGLAEEELRQALMNKEAPAQGKNTVRLAACQPVQRDRELLAFAVRFPEYRDDLAKEGLDRALTTERARIFWQKLVELSPQEILRQLDAGEKQFYVQCQMRTHQTDHAEQNEWDEVQMFLRHLQQRQELDDLNARLRIARLDGDFQEELRLLALFQDRAQG
ncbi:DNA primase [Desulfovibrionales bacterium]